MVHDSWFMVTIFRVYFNGLVQILNAEFIMREDFRREKLKNDNYFIKYSRFWEFYFMFAAKLLHRR